VTAPLRVSDFHFDLPASAIAQTPTPRRDGARLLVAPRDPEAGPVSLDHHVAELADLLRGDELLVLNDTRVVPARLRGVKPTGGRVELLALGEAGPRRFLAMARAAKPLREGTPVAIAPGVEVILVASGGGGRWEVALPDAIPSLEALLEAHGELPLPPYIERPGGPLAADRDRYQTVFAARPGAVAAPTAGLHFTEALLERLGAKGVEIARVTLHVGPGTFQPVRCEVVDEHRMHGERYEVTADAAAAITRARQERRPVVAVGTTVVRTLEAVAARRGGEVVADVGETDLFIRPGYRFAVVDQLLTNFHLPGSTLLMLVAALMGRERLLAAYRAALEAGFRFYSYGDAMWIR